MPALGSATTPARAQASATSGSTKYPWTRESANEVGRPRRVIAARRGRVPGSARAIVQPTVLCLPEMEWFAGQDTGAPRVTDTSTSTGASGAAGEEPYSPAK